MSEREALISFECPECKKVTGYHLLFDYSSIKANDGKVYNGFFCKNPECGCFVTEEEMHSGKVKISLFVPNDAFCQTIWIRCHKCHKWKWPSGKVLPDCCPVCGEPLEQHGR